jgi:hypothetical protein
MDKKTTRIVFSIEKTVSPKSTLDAAIYLSKKSNLSLTYVLTSDSYDLSEGKNEAEFKADFKRTYFKEIELVKMEGSFWKGLSKFADDKNSNVLIIGAKCVKAGFFGGGMAATVDAFHGALLFLNEHTLWEEPRTIIMPLDGQSETRQKFYRVAELAQITRAKVHVLGVSNPSDKDDARYVHTYSFQGKVYMEERKINANIEEIASKDCAQTIIEKANQSKPCWISAVSNTEGVFKTSAFQKVCELATVPVLIMPYKEISGMGGVGY